MIRSVVGAGVVLVSVLVALAGAELTLKNGEVIVAQGYRRVGNLYVLEVAGGEVLRVPADVVASLELSGDGDDDAGSVPNVVSTRKEPADADPRGASPAVEESGSPSQRLEAPRPAAGPPGSEPERPAPEGFTTDGRRDLTQRPANEAPWMRQGKADWKPEDGFAKDGLDNEWPKRTPTSFAGTGAAARAVNAFLLEEGVASWYGERFQGRPTASGRPFDAGGFTAAHPSLPFGTLVLVTNAENERSIILEVTDRGPSVGGRVINLSRAAAAELDMVERGLARVTVRIVGS